MQVAIETGPDLTAPFRVVHDLAIAPRCGAHPPAVWLLYSDVHAMRHVRRVPLSMGEEGGAARAVAHVRTVEEGLRDVLSGDLALQVGGARAGPVVMVGPLPAQPFLWAPVQRHCCVCAMRELGR